MRGYAGLFVMALAAAGCRSVPAPVAGGYRGVEQITILANGME
ncbi:MAG TPA: hypothetical protein VFS92_00895 [Planctomycetota bacterium]|nr:hypothetical protein [Planctomycetota bacterium]